MFGLIGGEKEFPREVKLSRRVRMSHQVIIHSVIFILLFIDFFKCQLAMGKCNAPVKIRSHGAAAAAATVTFFCHNNWIPQ